MLLAAAVVMWHHAVSMREVKATELYICADKVHTRFGLQRPFYRLSKDRGCLILQIPTAKLRRGAPLLQLQQQPSHI